MSDLTKQLAEALRLAVEYMGRCRSTRGDPCGYCLGTAALRRYDAREGAAARRPDGWDAAIQVVRDFADDCEGNMDRALAYAIVDELSKAASESAEREPDGWWNPQHDTTGMPMETRTEPQEGS